MMDDFRKKVIEHAKDAVKKAPNCKSEQSVNMFLILPFIKILGYDTSNPAEVCPEHHADFSEKYKNRVDFAILIEEVPIIAVESKQCGAVLKDDRGQLRSYFNACKSIKMGVLSDGLVFEFYADSDEPNMMDQTAFLTVDFGKIASGLIEENVIETLYSLQKITFDPENIGAEAKRKHIFRNVLAQLDGLYAAPSEAFVRMLLQGAGMSHLRQKLLDEYTPLVQDAFREFINQHILQRLSLGTASKETPATAEKAPVPIEPVLDSKIETTEQELALFAYVKQKLAFLVSDKILYDEITHIDYRDYQAKFVIFYRKERKGRLFDFTEMADGTMRFIFPDRIELNAKSFEEIDEPLLNIFKQRVAEEGAIVA